MRLKALTTSVTGMTDEQCEVDKVRGLRGGRKLRTTQVAKLVGTGRSWLGGWMREVPAMVSLCHEALASLSLRGAKRRSNPGGEPNRIVTHRLVGAHNYKSAWCWMKDAATKSWRRDLQEPVSSFYFGDGRENMTRFILIPRLSRCQANAGQGGADGQDHYRCPCGALHREGDGRSWAINNTPNVSGVE
jgi:hypothetical protein